MIRAYTKSGSIFLLRENDNHYIIVSVNSSNPLAKPGQKVIGNLDSPMPYLGGRLIVELDDTGNVMITSTITKIEVEN